MKKYLNCFGLLDFMIISMYTSRYGTFLRNTDKSENVSAKDILDPKGVKSGEDLEKKLGFTHMILTKNSADEDFVLDGFYRFGEKQDPLYVTIDDIKDNTSLKLTNVEAIKLLGQYIKNYN